MKCVLQERECIQCEQCSYCDLNPEKRCDNCCQCIESDADYRAIKITEILEHIEDDTSAKDTNEKL